MLIAAMLPVLVMAGNNRDKCRKEGCNRDNDPNGTIYCDKHAAEYAREKGYKVCSVTGCYDHACSGGIYCSTHTCRNKDCWNKAEEKGGYCSKHNPKKSTTSSSYSSKKNNSVSKKNSSGSSKKKYDSYNVYDYKSAQDFADDKYEEFYDYEDDYDDEDEAYDAAEDYWREHHGK